MEWLIPISSVWLFAAIYLGGWPRDVEGGTPLKQVIGLLITVALFLAAWAGLRTALGGMGFVGRVLLPTAVSTLLFPILAALGFRVMGVRVVKKAGR